MDSDQILKYAGTCRDVFNQSVSGLPVSPYSQEISEARSFVSDRNAIVFYLTPESARISANFLPQNPQDFREFRGGAVLIPQNMFPFSRFVQAATFNQVKILDSPDPTIRYSNENAHLYFNNRIPADLPKEATICSGSFSLEFLQAPIPNDKKITMNICLGPTRQFDDGYYKRDLPCRKRIYCPSTTHSGRFYLQHTWSFADILFEFHDLILSDDDVVDMAYNDVAVLRYMTTDSPLPGVGFFENPNTAAVNRIGNARIKLHALIEDQSTCESDIQRFFESSSNRFLLNPLASEIHSRRPIAGLKYVPDFICKKSNNDYHLIEIESPRHPIYNNMGDQSSKLTHAIRQVDDWLMYIANNKNTARTLDRLNGIDYPTGEVVIGRSNGLNEEAKAKFQYLISKSTIDIRTYDMLLSDIDAFINTIQKLEKCLK